MRLGSLMAVCGAACVAASTAEAQAGQRFSVQGSVLYADLNGDAHEGLDAGIGIEAQLRYNFPTRIPFSIGVGYQRTTHGFVVDDPEFSVDSDVPLSGFFVEPRVVINAGSERVAPYVSARFSYLTQDFDDEVFFPELGGTARIGIKSSGLTGNVGGGLLFNLAQNVNLDVGATFGFTNFGDTEYTIEGESFTDDEDFGSGTNFVLRAGLVIGFGGIGR